MFRGQCPHTLISVKVIFQVETEMLKRGNSKNVASKPQTFVKEGQDIFVMAL